MKKIVYDIESGETFETDYSAEELAVLEKQWAKARAEYEILEIEIKTKNELRKSLLTRLGISEEEAQLLLGGN